MSRQKVTEKEIMECFKRNMEPQEIADIYHVSLSYVYRRLGILKTKLGKKMSDEQFRRIIDTNIDTSNGLWLLYTMAVETTAEKRDEMDVWKEEKEEFQTLITEALDTGELNLQDPRTAWLEKFAREQDPTANYLRASAEARSCLDAYNKQRDTILNEQAMERIKEAMKQIYLIAPSNIRSIINEIVFTETVEHVSVVQPRELEDGSNQQYTD